MPKGGSLAKLLAVHRGRRHKDLLPQIDNETVNRWVLSHYLRTGRLPRVKDGEIEGSTGETWVGWTRLSGSAIGALHPPAASRLRAF